MERKAPLIFNYTNFRVYLRDAYTMRKSLDRKFSHRYINAKLGAKSSGWFSDVVTNRLGMKSKYIGPVASLFGLKEAETEYLRLLVELDQSDSLKDKTVALGRIMAFKGVKAESVVSAQFEFYEDWYHSALRELLLLVPFDGDFNALAKTLQPPILPKQARKSLLLMAKLGLVAQTKSGHWKPTAPIVVKDPALNSIHWALIQKAFIRLSLPAVEHFGKEERDISALTLNFSPQGFKKAGEEIAALRKRLLALSEQDRFRNRVYQCNFQVFPLSRPIEVANVSKP